MAQNVNRVVTVDALFQFIWGMESLEDTRTVAVHISNLRKKSRLTLPILRESLRFGGGRIYAGCQKCVASANLKFSLSFI
ncbi:helix-turn-helix domain-containing protein [Paenibacillus agaridevorans]|uniref:helix-turn-helix domain-containing protein n=1 Tax=Paenibacillus agaridevorans TaxID=171404 RepID=UPI001FE891D4|nr:helix-turn-helix domain-containing protein [Paenibacillus agaridevorans]